jgi:hypothetical protein
MATMAFDSSFEWARAAAVISSDSGPELTLVGWEAADDLVLDPVVLFLDDPEACG